MRLNLMAVLSMAVILWYGQALAEERSVRLATLHWEPYIGRNLPSFGFGAEILREAFHRAGHKVSFAIMPWVRALKEVEIGKHDAVCFAYHSQERERNFIFSAPYAESVLGFCKLRESDITVQSLQDLTPYRIGVVRGFVNTPEFDALGSLKKEEVKNEEMNLKKLLNRRVDLIVIDRFVMRHLMKTRFPAHKDTVEFLDPPLAVHPLHLMFSKKRKASSVLVREFNRAVENMKTDGTMKTIINRFGYGDAQ